MKTSLFDLERLLMNIPYDALHLPDHACGLPVRPVLPRNIRMDAHVIATMRVNRYQFARGSLGQYILGRVKFCTVTQVRFAHRQSALRVIRVHARTWKASPYCSIHKHRRRQLAKLAVLRTVTPCCYATLAIFGKVAGDRNEVVH